MHDGFRIMAAAMVALLRFKSPAIHVLAAGSAAAMLYYFYLATAG
jgi:hypothetical protein